MGLTMEFNKTTGTIKGRKPNIVFRKLPDTGNEPRYQGNINKSAMVLIRKAFDSTEGLEVVFSDKHSFIGFKPTRSKKLKTWFGATELFRELKLIVGQRYELTECKGVKRLLVIDSNEFNN